MVGPGVRLDYGGRRTKAHSSIERSEIVQGLYRKCAVVRRPPGLEEMSGEDEAALGQSFDRGATRPDRRTTSEVGRQWR